MLTRDDVIDVIVAGLSKDDPPTVAAPMPTPPAAARGLPLSGPKGRPFLSEHDIRRRLTSAGKRLTIPGNSILSPLAHEWLTLSGIEVIRE